MVKLAQAIPPAEGRTYPPLPAARLAEILHASLTTLAAAGEVEAACRLAGQACVTLRGSDPTAARRFDVLLHRLTPKLTW